MGKATRWLRSLLGSSNSKKSDSSSLANKDKKTKTTSISKWGVVKSSINTDNAQRRITWSSDDPSSSPYIESLDANKHAIAVAAATAAVAEAALAAAQAAAEVVRLTSAGGASATGGGGITTSYAGGGSSRERRRELAATKIQSAFRAYLARRALRALRGLVKLQALVRGRIVRKQSADMLHRMQAMARIQARACASRTHVSRSSHSYMKSSQFHHPAGTRLKNYDLQQHSYGSKHAGSRLKLLISQKMQRGGSKSNMNDNLNIEKLHLDSSWLDRWMEESTWNNHSDTSFKNMCLDDEKNDKILEIDTWKPRYNPRQSEKTYQGSEYFSAWRDNVQRSTAFDPISGLSTKLLKPNPSVSSGEVSSLRSLKFTLPEDQVLAWAADNSPYIHSASSRPGSSSRRGPFTPTRSECSRSLFGDYIGHPNYMANTESSIAKTRSQSAPRQRMQSEKLGTGNKFVHGLWDAETNSEKGFPLNANFRSKAYPGSGQSDTLRTRPK